MRARLCRACLVGSVLLAAAAGTGCSEGSQAEKTAAAGSAKVAGTGVRIDAEPRVVLAGDPSSPLVGVAGALRLSNETIVVANAGAQELQLFDASGRHLKTAGGEGDGPGEFRRLTRIRRGAGDSIYAFDSQERRISVFDPAGAFVRTFALAPAGRGLSPAPLGWFDDGTILARVPSTGALLRQDPGVVRDTLIYLRYAGGGTLIDTVGRFPGEEQVRVLEGEGRTRSSLVIPLPFGRRTEVAVAGDRFFVSDGTRFAVAGFGRDGSSTGLVGRTARRPREVTDDAKRAFLAEQLAKIGDPNGQREFRSRYADVQYPDVMPAVGQVLADPAGRLWVADYRAPGESETVWTVFDRSGAVIGTTRIPGQLEVLEIDAGEALCLWIDPDSGVEQVQVHPVRTS